MQERQASLFSFLSRFLDLYFSALPDLNLSLSWYHRLLEMMHLSSDFYPAGGSQGFLDVAIDGELTSGQSTDHEETGTNTSV
jgi:hypothetical protein